MVSGEDLSGQAGGLGDAVDQLSPDLVNKFCNVGRTATVVVPLKLVLFDDC